MNSTEALAFVRKHGVVLESASGPVPTLAHAIAGEKIRGGWWGHPKGDQIFAITRKLRDSREILVCRLVAGKVTYVHCRLWPALVRAVKHFESNRLAAIREIHTASGKHRVEETPYPHWVPKLAVSQAKKMSEAEAKRALGEWCLPKTHR